MKCFNQRALLVKSTYITMLIMLHFTLAVYTVASYYFIIRNFSDNSFHGYYI